MMLDLLACVAGLLGAPVPPMPLVIEAPRHQISSIRASRPNPHAVTIRAGRNIIVMIPPGASRALIGHEFAHVVQMERGWPVSEAQAEWTQRKIDVWCPSDRPSRR